MDKAPAVGSLVKLGESPIMTVTNVSGDMETVECVWFDPSPWGPRGDLRRARLHYKALRFYHGAIT